MDLPTELDTEEFREAYAAYTQMRREYNYPKWKESTVKLNFKKFIKWGAGKAAEALRTSTENTWRGVFEPNERTRRNSSQIGPGQRYDPNSGAAEF